MGPINVSLTGFANDIYMISIEEYYGQRYMTTYGEAKTKITFVGSNNDTTPWRMGGETVVENNEHLGQIVSGTKQEKKNIDL